MRVSRLYRPQTDAPEPEQERVPVARMILWGVVFLLLGVGLALFLVFGRHLSSLF